MNQSVFASPIRTSLLAKRYQIKKLIGRGGMGEVFLANDILLGGTPVAIKFLSQTFSDSKKQNDFAREASICAALSQKSLHIVRAFDYGVSEEGKPFYVMEYLCGQSLKELIPMPLPMFLAIFRQICLGLQCAHLGANIDGKIYPLVHRDIKPTNILVIPDPILGQLVKIFDFGIAKFLNYATTIGATKGFDGTLPYCSPEQLEEEELDNRSDIYSLGVMMFEMLTGQKPWQPETDLFGAWYKAHHFEEPQAIANINPNLKLPKELDDLIMACLAKSPSDRPQNIAEILHVLESLKAAAEDINIRGQSVPLSPILPIPTSGSHLRSGLTFAVEKACWKAIWPQDKPIQEIVFPQLLDAPQGTVAALSLMMSKQEINNRILSSRYNQFIFVTSPHPMLLWLTVLYSRELGPKWLPCYLDMQNPHNQKLVHSLAENERYPLIFFTLEAPHSCTNILSSRIDAHQRQMLKTWIEQSKSLPPSSQAQLTKNLLKQQYKQLQTRILQQLASN